MNIEADANSVLGRNGKGGSRNYRFSTLVLETSVVQPSWQPKIKKKGGGKDAEVKAHTSDIRVEVMKGG